jgi:hypothetical protein
MSFLFAVDGKVVEGTLIDLVEDVIRRSGETGLTDFDIADRYQLAPSSVSRSRRRLVKDGKVTDSNRERQTEKGSWATVWKTAA